MRGNAPARARGFSLIEVMVAMGLLGTLIVGVASSQGDAMYRAVEVMNLTRATQIIEGVVLNIEEEYRTDGFPTNQVEKRDCADMLPRDFRGFDCEYDLLMLEVNGDAMQAMGSDAMEKVNGSALMNTFCGAEGQAAAANIAAVCSQLQVQGGVGLPIELAAFAPLCDPGLSQICGVNLDKMCQNTGLITSFIPMIIEQAAATTRKLKVRISWGDDGLIANNFEIETFITATPEAEPEQ
ncbi:MAG: type II secretion system protein [Deltaproteobacteria bacterium]|nr:MAG: type II secretion system protein [Deltaproteobacteria bacterium]